MKSVTVRVPATSANLGAGFDSLGLALNLYHVITLSEADHTRILVGKREQKEDENKNLILKAARAVYEKAGAPLPGGFFLRQNSRIPSARGLGSSAACIAGGLLAANRLLGDPLDLQTLLEIGVSMEGHPDNLVPAFLGGFCVSAWREGKVLYKRCALKRRLRFVVMIPEVRMKTGQSRAVLPEMFSREDCAFQLAGAALTSAAFFSGDYSLLRRATEDRLCSPCRLPLIPAGDRLEQMALDSGAVFSTISGSGSTILALFDQPGQAPDNLVKAVKEADFPVTVRAHLLRGDNRGAQFLLSEEM